MGIQVILNENKTRMILVEKKLIPHGYTMKNFFKTIKASKRAPSTVSPTTPQITKSQEELSGNFCDNPSNEGKPVAGLPSFICRGGTAVNTASSAPNAGRDYLIAFVFPDFEPRLDPGQKLASYEKVAIKAITGEFPREGRCGKVGHAGVIVIKEDGNVILAEFGRYGTAEGKGRIIMKNVGNVAKFSSNGKLANAKEVASAAKRLTHGDGPQLRMVAALIPIQKDRIDDVIGFISRKSILDYELFDRTPGGAANCGTFTNDAAIAAGAGINASSVESMPIKMIEDLKSIAEDYFSV